MIVVVDSCEVAADEENAEGENAQNSGFIYSLLYANIQLRTH